MTYDVVLVEFEAAPPVDPSEVGGGQPDDVQLERLLHEYDVVLGHTETVEVARGQSGSEGNGTDLLHLAQRRLVTLVI